MTGLIIYASKYGSTGEYAALIAEKLSAKCIEADEVTSEDIDNADYLVLGSPVYAYSVLPEMEDFLDKHQEILAGKPLAAFVVCGDTLWNPEVEEGGEKNLRKLTDLLPGVPFAVAVLGGRMIMEDLDAEDGPRIRAFYERIGREPAGFDRMDLSAADAFVERIKEALAKI